MSIYNKKYFYIFYILIFISINQAFSLDDEYSIDFSKKRIAELQYVDQTEFEYEEICLTNITSNKFNAIKEALSLALSEGDHIKKIIYSYDPNTKKFPRAVDEFMYYVADRKRVVVEKFGDKSWSSEMAPLVARMNKNAAENYQENLLDRRYEAQAERIQRRKENYEDFVESNGAGNAAFMEERGYFSESD